MSLISWAERELELAGYRADEQEDEPNKWMKEGVLELLKVFAEQGHSGSSAPFAVSLFERLASFKPISPLTGEDDEWVEVSDGLWQNRRASDIFKDGSGNAWWGTGVVFWRWETTEDGERYRDYFTSCDSQVPVEFPFTVPDGPEYREVPADMN